MIRAPLARLRRLAAAREGAAAVEAAFVLPLLLLLLLGTIEFGRLAWTRVALDYAVQEAARCASVRPDLCGSNAQIAAFAAQKVQPLNIPASAFSVSSQACGVQVRAEVSYAFAAYAIFKAQPKLSAQTCRL